MTLTKEQLIDQAQKNIAVLRGAAERMPGASEAAVIHIRLAEITLASLTAEPALYCMSVDGRLNSEAACTSKRVVDAWVSEWNESDTGSAEPAYKTVPLYTAPPAPVVPEEWQQWITDAAEYLEGGLEADGELEAEGSIEAKRLLSHRAAMLQGKAEQKQPGGPGGVHANVDHHHGGAGDGSYGRAGDDLSSRGYGGGK